MDRGKWDRNGGMSGLVTPDYSRRPSGGAVEDTNNKDAGYGIRDAGSRVKEQVLSGVPSAESLQGAERTGRGGAAERMAGNAAVARNTASPRGRVRIGSNALRFASRLVKTTDRQADTEYSI